MNWISLCFFFLSFLPFPVLISMLFFWFVLLLLSLTHSRCYICAYRSLFMTFVNDESLFIFTKFILKWHFYLVIVCVYLFYYSSVYRYGYQKNRTLEKIARKKWLGFCFCSHLSFQPNTVYRTISQTLYDLGWGPLLNAVLWWRFDVASIVICCVYSVNKLQIIPYNKMHVVKI